MSRVPIETFGITDRGVVRDENQDQFFIAELSRRLQMRAGSLPLAANSTLAGSSLGLVMMVADGMGGHRGGQEASGLAIRFFLASILNRLRWNHPSCLGDDADLVEDLKLMLTQAHREIQRQSEVDRSLEGMGTTFTLAYIAWPKMIVLHAGDTRCYLYRRGELTLLTHDHTLANQMIQNGRLDANDPERSRWSSVLVNALGAGANEVFADITKVELLADDVILLCSDGLNKHIDDRTIRSVLSASSAPIEICETLVALAKDGGGSDNITVVAAGCHDLGAVSTMQIHTSAESQESLFQELPFPTEYVDTSPDERVTFATSEYADTPTRDLERPC
ncbi:MAG: serine/threonine-protein phosphatase [Planctomycetes bacterium]|nr:serine/threonine-protein phosphatase [Planctomycetota bacterium]